MYQMTEIQGKAIEKNAKWKKSQSIIKKEKELKKLHKDSKRWRRKKREIENLS